MAMSILLISGGIDLSIGNIMVVCGVVIFACLPFYMSNMSCWLRGIKSTSSVKNLSRCRSNHLTV